MLRLFKCENVMLLLFVRLETHRQKGGATGVLGFYYFFCFVFNLFERCRPPALC